jgi:glucose/arabinose dehydrogenase
MTKKFYFKSSVTLLTLCIALVVAFIVNVVYQRTVIASFQTAQEVNARNTQYDGNPNMLTYRPVTPFKASIRILASGIDQVSDLQISSDGNYLLATTLPGNVYVFEKKAGTFIRQDQPFFSLSTSKVTMPAFQIGMTGVAFGADFATSGDVFLFYSEDSSGQAGKISESKNPNQAAFKNKITRVTLSKTGKGIFGKNPATIFTGNALAAQAHQIEKGVGVMISGKPSLLFTIGDSFNAANAQNPSIESGKLMLIQRDGTAVPGKRPFPEDPKIQGISLRNGTSLSYDSKSDRMLMTDTSNDNYDRLMSGTFFDKNGNNSLPLSFNWNGDDLSLLSPVPDLYTKTTDTVTYRWSPSETPVNSSFYSNPILPKLPSDAQYVLVTTFGEPLSLSNKPGKRILLGVLHTGDHPVVTFRGLIERTFDGKNKLGNPIGLAVDPTSKDIYFGDLMEGNIYKVTLVR